MKTYLSSLVLIFFLLIFQYPVLAQSQSPKEWLVEKGSIVPDFDFTWKNDKQDKISNYKGKVVLINFFATWCGPCLMELPRVQKEIWDRYKNNSNFSLFVFGREENWDILDPFIAKTGYTFPILPDLDRKIFSKFATQSIPRNIIIDEEGNIIYQSIGYSEKEFDKMLEVLEQKIN